MAMQPFVPFQLPEEYIATAEGILLWPESPELHFDCATAFVPDFTAEFDPPPVPPPAVRPSAFRRHVGPDPAQMMECSSSGCGSGSGSGRNIHLRVIGMLWRMRRPEERAAGVETSRGFRHMMRERQRREKLSQSYADLYSIVASRSKSDKNSIVQSAAEYVRELEGVREALRKRNEELRAQILGNQEGEKIEIKIANASSPVDSMIGALRCLQAMDVKARAIHSDLSRSNFSATMSIETRQSGAADVERAVEGVLMEMEKNLRCQQIPGINVWY